MSRTPSPSVRSASPVPGAAPLPVSVLPLTGLGEVREGADLAALLAEALAPLSPREGDVLCVSTKIVSKALGCASPPRSGTRRSRGRPCARSRGACTPGW